MIIKRIKNLVSEFRTRDENHKKQNNELIWANIFHDTIKDRTWLKNLSLSPGRWAADYSFLYVLVRILTDYKPKRIIEFGLGETSKIISSFLDNDLYESTYTILEQDEKWMEVFNNKFKLSVRAELIHMPLVLREIKGFQVNAYSRIEEKKEGVFDLYIVDGPFGSPRYSRYDIYSLAEKLQVQNEFIIIIDDFNRQGEIDTATDLIDLFNERGIKIYTGVFSGIKSQLVIATEKYKHVISV